MSNANNNHNGNGSHLRKTHWRIPSDTRTGRQVVSEILERLERAEWSEGELYAVHLALEEALVNAIKHGNGMNVEKQVEIRLQLTADILRVHIADEGRGFSQQDVPDPTLEENLERPSGRGIMLMYSFMDEVQYSDQGNAVTMEKRRR